MVELLLTHKLRVAWHRCALVLLMLIVLFSLTLQAQVGSSTITGRVTDSSGAIVPGVTVSIIQTDTNFQFTAVTNQDGLYRLIGHCGELKVRIRLDDGDGEIGRAHV